MAVRAGANKTPERRLMPENQTQIPRALSVRRQLLIVLAVSIAGVAAWLLSVAPAAPIVATGSATGRASTSSFMPTPEQRAGLTIEPASMITFRAETVTDGSIAIDEDLTTPVFSPFSGRVTKVAARLGDRVAKGATLMEIEASEFVQAQSELITAKAQYDLAVTNEKRQHDLYDAQGAALKDWQQAQVDLASAEAALAAVRNRLRIMGKTDIEIESMEQLRAAPGMNAVSAVTAPISGTIVQRKVGLGQYVQAGSSDPVFSIGDLSTVWLVANVREVDAPKIHTGDRVEVHVLAFPGRVFAAQISYVAPAIDPATRRLAVRADVANRDGLLKPQMFANFTILTGSDTAAVGIPQSAIVYEGDTARVWLSTGSGALSSRQIRTGRTNGEMVEVVSGLSPGERVVVRGAVFIDRAAATQQQ